MIRSFLLTLFAIFVFIPTIQAADPFESTICASGTMTMIHGSKELTVMSFELKGMARSNTNSEIYNNASEWCVGLLRQMGDEWTQSGFCKYMYLNGDFHIGEFDGDAKGGNWKFLLGTGKWEGIKGSGSWSMIQRAKPIAPGTFQNCRKIEGTFELPK
jgi:hypothetical protein